MKEILVICAVCLVILIYLLITIWGVRNYLYHSKKEKEYMAVGLDYWEEINKN